MKWILSITCSFFVILAFGQVNQVDAKGRKQGKWEKVYPGTRVYIYTGEFKDDKPIGKFTYFYKSSKTKAIIEHKEGSPRSEGYYYHETGGLMSYGIFNNQKKDSVWVNWDKNGKLSSKETFLNDSLDGVKVVYYIPKEGDQSQRPSSVYRYKNGQLHGTFEEYFESGKMKRRGEYKDDKKVGIWESFHPDGQKMTLERFKEGKKHGWCYAYDNLGKEIGKKYFYYGRHLEGKELKQKMSEMKRLGIQPNE